MKIEQQTIETLRQFYSLMSQTCQVRSQIVARYLDSEVDPTHIDSLNNALLSLRAITNSDNECELQLDGEGQIALELSYEIEELKKDILFLKEGEKAFHSYLKDIHPAYIEQVKTGIEMFRPVKLYNFISDRDGTINNYCGRYLSSIQSVYNAIFLTRFAKKRVKNSVILTSAPLENGGLIDVSTVPPGVFINAGSKGREYRDLNGKRGTLGIIPEKKQKLDELNKRLEILLNQPKYEKFTLIGSGLQRKYGQTTVARQDVNNSIPQQQSTQFLQILQDLVNEVDPQKEFFRIEDTSLDVEIILTYPSVDPDEEMVDFNKGNGIAFLNEQLDMKVDIGPNLVCGDTNSDVVMVEECLKQTDNTWTIFVTKEAELKKRIKDLTPYSLIVDEPDILVTILDRLASAS